MARTDGSTAELTVAPVRNVHRLPDGVDLALAALIEPLSCAIHGYDLLPRRMGEHYLVYGAGTMGLMMAQLAPRAGAASVTVVDRNPPRLEVARELGVEQVLISADEADRTARLGRRHRLHRGRRGDRGRTHPGTTRRRLPAVRRRPTDATARYSPFGIYNDEISVVGSMAVLHSYARAVEMFAAGALRADRMVSHAYALDDYGDALDTFRAGTGRKLQIRPQASESHKLL